MLGRRKKLVVYAAYQSPVQSASQGQFTFHQQQLTEIKLQKAKAQVKEATKDKETRQKCQDDLLDDMSKYARDEYDMVIMADFNETDERLDSIVAQLKTKYHLTDVWAQLKPNDMNIPTYERGRHRLDFCLASENVASHITDIYVTNFREISNSDHRGIVFDMKESYFTEKQHSTKFLDRTLLSNDAVQVGKYLQKLHDLLRDQNIFDRTESLCESEEFRKDDLEKIDQAITEACLIAEKKLKRRRRPWWSKKVNKLRIRARILGTHLSRLKQGFRASVHLQWKCDSNDLQLTLPWSIKETKQLLAAAKEELKDGIKHSKDLREEEQLTRIDVNRRMGDMNQAKIQKLIYQKERLAEAFRKVKSIRKQQENQQLNKLDIPLQWLTLNSPNPDTLEDPKHTKDWTTITNQTEINKFLLLRNKKHFN